MNQMKITLACNECDFTDTGYIGKELMNKIIMWNHIKVNHLKTTNRIAERNVVLPDYFFHTLQA